MIIIPILVVLTILTTLYFIIVGFYKQHFTFGTTINGYYCAGMTVEELNPYLVEETKDTCLTVNYLGGTEVIPLNELCVSLDYSEGLRQKLLSQRPLFWGIRIVIPYQCKVEPDIIFDENQMLQKLHTFDFMKVHTYNKENTVSIIKDDESGYILVDDTKDLLVDDIACKVIAETLRQGKFTVSLEANNCYRSLAETSQMRETKKKYEKIAAFQDFSMVYHLKDTDEVVDSAVVANWIMLDDAGDIVFDEEGNPVLDRNKFAEYITYLSETYGIASWVEYEFLLNAFLNKESGEREPVYYY